MVVTPVPAHADITPVAGSSCDVLCVREAVTSELAALGQRLEGVAPTAGDVAEFSAAVQQTPQTDLATAFPAAQLPLLAQLRGAASGYLQGQVATPEADLSLLDQLIIDACVTETACDDPVSSVGTPDTTSEELLLAGTNVDAPDPTANTSLGVLPGTWTWNQTPYVAVPNYDAFAGQTVDTTSTGAEGTTMPLINQPPCDFALAETGSAVGCGSPTKYYCGADIQPPVYDFSVPGYVTGDVQGHVTCTFRSRSASAVLYLVHRVSNDRNHTAQGTRSSLSYAYEGNQADAHYSWRTGCNYHSDSWYGHFVGSYIAKNGRKVPLDVVGPPTPFYEELMC
jgi:hypothetical protein